MKKINKNILSFPITKEEAFENLKKGNLIGTCLSIIYIMIERFNYFNKINNFEICMGNPDIRHFKEKIAYYPDDIRLVSGLSENENESRFTQLFLPYNSIFIFYDHILGGEGVGEYKRNFTKIDLGLLEWYFNFYNYFDDDLGLCYNLFDDYRTTEIHPIKPLFGGLNIIVAYIPTLLYNNIFTEAVIRINIDRLMNIIDSKKAISKNDNTVNKNAGIYSINKMATDDELDSIVESIIKQ